MPFEPVTGEVAFPASHLGRVVWAWFPAVALALAIFVASGVPDLSALPGGLSDKTWHFVAYAALGGFALRGLASAEWVGVTSGRVVTAWVLTAAYGATDEVHQRFVPGRTAAIDDWAADVSGAFVALAFAAIVAVGLRAEGRRV